ncbi:MAG TPA: triose-phosphate isomerase, partial [Flavobacteriales bacterium]|nr:triose-phosphate isomerase [Flavobacteriales bacterium]
MIRKKIIAGNWKMNKTASEAHALVKSIMEVDINPSKKQVIVIPPQLYVSEFSKYKKEGFAIGAQNCHALSEGAFTGEISAPMLQSTGIEYCLVGHSERRKYFNETDADCLAKVRSLFASNIIPILCVGEELNIRESNYHFQHVIHQLSVVY